MMNNAPEPPRPDEDQALLAARQRREQDIIAMGTDDLPAAPSWGERLLPIVFAAVETCWVSAILIGIADIDLFGSHDLLMPLWAPFVFIAGASWFATYLERREVTAGKATVNPNKATMISGSQWVFPLLLVFALFIIWASVYASTTSIINPRWLWDLLNDMLLLSPRAYRIFTVFILSGYFCWRGLALARRIIEPADVFNAMRLGMGVIIAVIVVHAGTGGAPYEAVYLLLLIPIFLCLALLAHALSRALFVRHSHPIGLEGSTVVQERALLTVIGAVGLILLLISLAIGTFASPAFLASVQQAMSPLGMLYNWIVSGLAYGLVFLSAPIFWLFSLLHPSGKIHIPTQPPNQAPRASHLPPQTPQAVLATIAVLKIVLPLLCIAIIGLLIWWALRRRRVRLVRSGEDLRESLWSWQLFWTQLKALLLALWSRLFPQRAPKEAPARVEEEIGGEPAARSIREIYRALLKWAAALGYRRKKDETPYEFRQRLGERLPQVEPELGTITDAYTATRYGEIVPAEEEVARVRGEWMGLQQKATTL
jgi:hypothetical protein